jgi:hypothetical protein
VVTSTMTPLSSCWTLSFFSSVSVIKILCILGLAALGATRNAGRQLHIQMFCRSPMAFVVTEFVTIHEQGI